MLRGEFHKSLPLLLTGQQLSVLRSLVYYSSSMHFLFETGIRLTRYGKFVNEILTMHRAKISKYHTRTVIRADPFLCLPAICGRHYSAPRLTES